MAFGDFTVDRNSTKYVLGASGDLVSYATDEPAFEFNTDGSYKGLLVEPAATNLILQSEDLNTTWIAQNAAPATVTDETPDGDTSSKYIKLVDDNTGGTGLVRVQQLITLSANTKYTASVFLKSDQLTFARLEANGYDGATSGTQYFELTGTGSLGTASNLDDSSIEAYPNGWYRCTITWTQGAADTDCLIRIFPAASIGSATVDLDGTSSIFVWGAQVEEGPIATSYIPTTTASVTRAKDDITLGSASSLIGQTEGTMYVEVDWRDSDGLAYLFEINDNSISDFVAVVKTNTNQIRMIARANNSELASIAQTGVTNTGVQKIAAAYKTNDFELYVNGSSIGTDTSGNFTVSAPLAHVDIGQNYNAGAQANMWIRAVALFPTRLSDAECQALTTL